MSITKITTVTLGSAATQIDLASIPSTFTDLYLVMSIRGAIATNADDIGLKLNDSAANGSARYLQSNASNATSNANSYLMNTLEPAANSTGATYGNTSVYIPNYSGSTNKSMSVDNISENNGNPAYMRVESVIWSQTAAINKITIYSLNGTNLSAYSSATLYGITKGSLAGVTVS